MNELNLKYEPCDLISKKLMDYEKKLLLIYKRFLYNFMKIVLTVK